MVGVAVLEQSSSVERQGLVRLLFADVNDLGGAAGGGGRGRAPAETGDLAVGSVRREEHCTILCAVSLGSTRL
jgi:hypothetical protein